jgi:hypothetical protein
VEICNSAQREAEVDLRRVFSSSTSLTKWLAGLCASNTSPREREMAGSGRRTRCRFAIQCALAERFCYESVSMMSFWHNSAACTTQSGHSGDLSVSRICGLHASARDGQRVFSRLRGIKSLSNQATTRTGAETCAKALGGLWLQAQPRYSLV